MEIRDFIKNNIVILDGGMGTLLQAKGLKPGEHPERWNISHPEAVISIHKAYYEAGSNIVNTNTFGANGLKFEKDELEEIIGAAILNAKKAREESAGDHPKFVALDIGPCGKLLKPYGDLEFEKAVELFAEIVRLGVKYRADLITIETMNDSYETKAALLAAKENSDLPVIVTNAYGGDYALRDDAKQIYAECGRVLAELHDAGLYHHDTKPANFVYNECCKTECPHEVCLVDCDNVTRTVPPVPTPQRIHNLAQFIAGTGNVARQDRVLWRRLVDAFCAGYTNHAKLPQGDLDQLWQRVWRTIESQSHIEYTLPDDCLEESTQIY